MGLPFELLQGILSLGSVTEMQYLRQATGFFKGAAVGKALRDAAWSSAEQRLGKVQRAYAEVTGTAEVQQVWGT